jgi:ribonuclease HI
MVDIPEVYAFFDGACSGNGRRHAKAGFGVVIKTIPGSIINYKSGVVEPYQYEFVDPGNPLEGIQVTRKPCVPSNNRGEYLGFIWALLGTLRVYRTLRGRPPVTIVSDSMLCIRTIKEWLPNRRKKNTIHELKNLDLVLITEALMNELNSLTKVVLWHVRSHKKAPPRSGPTYAYWKGNDQVDRLATRAVNGDLLEGNLVALTDAQFDAL